MHDDIKELYSSLQSLIQATSSISDAIKLIQHVEKLAFATTDIDQLLATLETAEQLLYSPTPLDEVTMALDFASFLADYRPLIPLVHTADTSQSSPLNEPGTKPDTPEPPTPTPPLDSHDIPPATLSEQADATLMNLRYDGYTPEAIANQIGKTVQWIGRRTGRVTLTAPIIPTLAEQILTTDWRTVPKTLAKTTTPTTNPAPAEPTAQDQPTEEPSSKPISADNTSNQSPKESLLS